MSSCEDIAYIAHIREAVDSIREYTQEGRDSFMEDRKTQDAVIRNLEIIGEAVKQLSPFITEKYDHIPWTKIAGMRDRLIHHYFGVDLNLVWRVVAKRLDPLYKALEKEQNLATNQSSSTTDHGLSR